MSWPVPLLPTAVSLWLAVGTLLLSVGVLIAIDRNPPRFP